MFDFGALPPEVNSGRIYAGPGSGPMMAAAAAWDEVAAEVATAASGYGSVISELTDGPWAGPASSSMLSAVLPYASWLSAVAALAEDTAGQGRAAAAAFEAAFAMTVPPPVITANRTLLATLIATNFFGQNSAAIAATEAEYAEMWAQDAAAMYGYAAASVTVTTLAPFDPPPSTTNPDGLANQGSAVAQAVEQPAGDAAQTAANASSQLSIPQVLSATTTSQATQQVTAAATAPTTTGASLQDVLPSPTNWWSLTPANYTTVLKQTSSLLYQSNGLANFGWSMGQQLTFGPGGATAGAGGAWFPTPQFAQLGLGNLGSIGGGAVSAGAGTASHVGALSVPQQWATLTSAVGPADAAGAEAIPAQAAVSATTPPGNALLRGVPTGAIGRRTAAAGYSHKYGFRYSVLTRPPSAG
ncbi:MULTISPECIES: PPE family protein [unclassified Mycobacterium]|uniref:PPE family protein n=1 Tax=unclassified Mycobacterium TaxID=2642494 RepID=UPI000800AC39|nr:MULTISPECIES: PPE family protein [unclassified Mycobacterium]OBI19715.1 hypothetical protein A5713_15730 [Mycobacterium sp. E2497]